MIREPDIRAAKGDIIMIRISKSCLAVLLATLAFAMTVTTATKANAEILPSFSLDFASWRATEIVVVDEGDTIDGRLTVIESLQGDLKKGQVILAPKMKQFADASWRTVGRSLFQGNVLAGTAGKQMVLTGRHMILFLQRPPKRLTVEQLKHNDHITLEGRTDRLWIPAGFGGMITSTIWIDKGGVYSFVQERNPGPSFLRLLRQDEQTIRARIRKLASAQEDLQRIAKMKDKAAAAKQAAAYVDRELYMLREHAFEVLGSTGKAGLPMLLEILADPKKTSAHSQAVGALVLIDGTEVDAKLIELFSQDRALWRKLGPTLKKGWWNGTGLEWKTVRLHRDQYSRTLAYVRSFEKRPLAQALESLEPLEQFARFWRSLPQLEDRSGLDQMSKACDSAVRTILIGIAKTECKRASVPVGKRRTTVEFQGDKAVVTFHPPKGARAGRFIIQIDRKTGKIIDSKFWR